MTDEAKQGVFGIDLGTTYSAVAYIDETGKPVIARNASGEETTPSVVLFENESNVVVGTVAKETTVTMPDSVVSLVKRMMGDADYVREFYGETYSAPALSGLILRSIAKAAEEDTGRKVEQAVITVPAYFGMLEKSATAQAGELAGINVIGIVPEPVAAALSYGLGSESETKTILVYDLGGGTFDVTVIRMGSDEIRVLTVDGDHKLGGADWDFDLVEHIVEEVTSQLGADSIRDDEATMQEIWIQAEKAKRHLSAKDSVPVFVRHSGGAARVDVTREQFEELTRHRLDSTLEITRRALATLDANHPGAKEEIDDVLLVGGSSKMPTVAARLKDEFGWDARLSDPELAVAKGAALYAAGQWGKIVDVENDDGEGEEGGSATPRFAETDDEKDAAIKGASLRTAIPEETLKDLAKREIVSALPKAIGIKLVDTTVPGWESTAEKAAYVEHLVPAQTEIPLTEPVTFPAGVAEADADNIVIEIWEQAGAVAGRDLGENRLLETGLISGLRDLHLPAGSPVDILFTISGDGIALVDAREPTSGNTVHIEAQIQLLDAETMADQRVKVAALTATT
jgi:molecular chaperone DnaK (HSP70)